MEADLKLIRRKHLHTVHTHTHTHSQSAPWLQNVDKPVSRIKPKKTPTTTGKMVKKSKEKVLASSLSAKKKPSLGTPEPKPDGVVTKKSKEISNRLAEANH
ncbi:hypothetical protein JOQ06_017621 [Pogonophryne albipinna]|uniref:Uncharacterized protein n=1 Tax=Pogonophryne albipinna TaxID=1090488 RepID=A0AAD6B3N1_9TELE|nr:hypothetical protein JOQ06_017621 [Pogonophryne albipinna]